MRELTNHRVQKTGEPLVIESLDDRHHEYAISWQCGDDPHSGDYLEISFQAGPAEVEVNGVSELALLAIVEDRLLAGLSGGFARYENGLALKAVQAALTWLKRRTVFLARREEMGLANRQVH